ncbi:MAG TPA: TRAP transporter TatT component family protein [Vicinamibacteria bacterium]|nr:TRAP transporter TatT component family protein [Vicinamibacteria bacterium]
MRVIAALATGAAALLSLAGAGLQPQAPSSTVVEADRLHAEADDPASALAALRQEVRLLDQAVAQGGGRYELLWRAARASGELGTRRDGSGRREAFEHAIELGRRAVAARPDRVEGHYWLAAAYGRDAEARGGLKGFLLARRLRGEMETVVRLQPDYQGGDAFLALGELDRALPGWLGGDRARGRRTLEAGLRVAPGNAELKLELARAYLDEHRTADARRLLEALAVPAAPAGVDEAVARQARELLASTASRP